MNRIRKPDDPSSDAEIIRRFVQHRDEAAFELLVWRHGSLVMSVCRRMVRDDHIAEDAFQATFLILARKAGSCTSRFVLAIQRKNFKVFPVDHCSRATDHDI